MRGVLVIAHLIDITGNKYGRLTVVAFDHIGDYRQSYWKCKCDCGNEVIVRKSDLVYDYSSTRSCGCLRIECSTERLNANRNLVTGKHEKIGVNR